MFIALRCRSFLLVAVLLVSAVSFHTNVSAATPLVGGGVKILINFADQQQSKFVFIGNLPAAPGVNLAGMQVGLSVGGVQRTYMLSPEGEGVATPDLFQLRNNGNGFSFICSTLDNSLANAFNSFGLINSDSSEVPVTMPVSISFNGATYMANLSGRYYAKSNDVGKAYLGVILPPTNPYAVVTHIATLGATPNPSQANQTVTIAGTASLKNFSGAVLGSLHFGDNGPPIHADGKTFVAMLKKGITHTYAADGVYVARVSLIGTDEISDTRLFVIVGDNWVVNSKNGAVGRLIKSAGGGVTLQIGVGNVPGAQTAQTKFYDMKGATAGRPPMPPPPGGQVGLAPSNTFIMPGVYVAEAMALDPGGKPLGKLRKTIGISATNLNFSSRSTESESVEVAPRASTTDNPITLSSMSGKFLFSSATAADKVVFNGKITLPAGFTPNNPTGNDITIAMGNVLDTVHLNEKNKFVSPSTAGYITKFQLAAPHLKTGIATGSEPAKVSITMNTTDLDVKGFDSEGVSTSLRSDEAGQTSVARFIQLEMLVHDQSYSSLIQVDYVSLSSNGDLFGTISGRSSKK